MHATHRAPFSAATAFAPTRSTNIANQLEAVGKTWRGYGEDMGTPCNTADSGKYAPRHVPFLYYDSIRTDPARCNNVLDYTNLELGDDAPNLQFIAPNLDHDMHDPVVELTHNANIKNGDTWVGTEIFRIINTDAYKNGGLLVIVWDEDKLLRRDCGRRSDSDLRHVSLREGEWLREQSEGQSLFAFGHHRGFVRRASPRQRRERRAAVGLFPRSVTRSEPRA